MKAPEILEMVTVTSLELNSHTLSLSEGGDMILHSTILFLPLLGMCPSVNAPFKMPSTEQHTRFVLPVGTQRRPILSLE